MRLPYAAPRRTNAKAGVTEGNKRDAQHALAATRGGGGIILLSSRQNGDQGGRHARKVARAFNALMHQAEERHRRYWKEHSDEA